MYIYMFIYIYIYIYIYMYVSVKGKLSVEPKVRFLSMWRTHIPTLLLLCLSKEQHFKKNVKKIFARYTTTN